MRNPIKFLKEEYQELVNKSLNWGLHVLQSASTAHCRVDGRDVLMLCSNNYLGLTNHPKVKEAAIEAIHRYGAGSGSVRPIAGNMELHMNLEKRMAEFKHTEAALTYQTGFAANTGLIPQLAGKGDLIVSDELNHGSIIDGVRLSTAERTIFKHRDVNDLEKILNEAETKNYRRILIITDGVFSMDGDIAPIDKIIPLVEAHGAMMYIDDAHGDGVLGEKGRGISSHFHLEGRIHVEMGTFSKAFGVLGGFIAGSRDLVNFAYNRSRTWLLSASHPPAVAAASIAALDVVETEPQHLKNLWDNTKYFKKGLKELGFDIGISETPITPIIVGESGLAKQMSNRLYEEGIFALPIVFPMVARDKARIRTIMNATLTKDDLDFALSTLERIGRELKII